jgi:hypothetical protein
VATTSVIEPSIIYPLVTTFFPKKDIKPIDSKASQMKCLSVGLSCKFPRAILHGPMVLGGIGNPSTTQKNTKDCLNYHLYNIRCHLSICVKLEISMIFTQIEVGSFTQFFHLAYEN